MFRSTKSASIAVLARGLTVSLTTAALLVAGAAAQAANYTATTSGNWSTSAT